MIRLATSADLGLLSELENRLLPSPMDVVQLEQELRHGFGLVEGEPVYAYLLARVDGPFVDVTRLAVAPSMQRHGVGTRLLERIFLLGKVTLLTVRKNNQRALRLYRKLGFDVCGHVGKEGDFPSWIMQRQPRSAPPLK
jgi:ribosomal protein S18 acetylase RimI-like enzyme